MRILFLLLLLTACERKVQRKVQVLLMDGTVVMCEGIGRFSTYNCETGYDYPWSQVMRYKDMRVEQKLFGE